MYGAHTASLTRTLIHLCDLRSRSLLVISVLVLVSVEGSVVLTLVLSDDIDQVPVRLLELHLVHTPPL